jgi:two-component system LytT family response regulator
MAPEIRALIVDDEPVARAGIRRLLEDDPDIIVVGEAGNGRSAVRAITTLRPDLLFLDIQMPEMDGFQVLEQITPQRAPTVVFVTAYDRFALRAFEVQALDYVLKPFEDERFFAVLARAKQHVRQARDGDLATRLAALLAAYESQAKSTRQPLMTESGPARLARILVKQGDRVFFLPVEEIDWIEAADYYARIHAGGTSHLVRETMGALESQLDETQFVRVHRSAIVNAERVKEIRADWRNHPVVVLETGVRLPVARTRRAVLERVMRGGARARE